jgi:hypothetical protein
MAPCRAQLRIDQIGVRYLGKSTVAKRGNREIAAQLAARTIALTVALR